MMVKLFMLGCSGSGKSTAAHYILRLAQESGYSAVHLNDYGFLYEMFLADIKARGQKFRSTEYGGFDVLNPDVYTDALILLKQEAKYQCSQGSQVVIVEFARDDYREAFELFGDGFLQDAYFFYIDSKQNICIRRIHDRAVHPTTRDDHFVPNHIIMDYRHEDNRQYISFRLKTDYGITKGIEIIDNMGSQREFLEKVRSFAEQILEEEM